MPRYYYGTVPVLAWILNHYFYGGRHYAWLAGEFHPLRTNPNSSNPYVIYGQLYAAWAWRDAWDKYVKELRKSLQSGVDAHQDARTIDTSLAKRLHMMCETVPVELFYPVVYRVDIEQIASERRMVDGSALIGSDEFLVCDLGETEFELLFVDNALDQDFVRFVLDAPTQPSRASAEVLLRILEGRA
ncbi:MAG TPA: hypothetical protein VJT67_03885 [Longimicrobiaceae bacterium]|nr:hypothetical protein [Longimicrobiaceae bacterium]